MENTVDNIITLSNMYEVVSQTLKKVGYEFQAPLGEVEEQEVISRQIKAAVVGEEE